MVEEENWIDKIRKVAPKFILFSGGGNDILGDPLLEDPATESSPGILVDRETLGLGKRILVTKGSVRRNLINSNVLEAQIRNVRERYVEIIEMTAARTRELKMRRIPIVVHGYDYTIPDGRKLKLPLPGFKIPAKGPWLKKAMDARKITHMGEKKKIVEILIDDFNCMLSKLAKVRKYSRYFHYVDCRSSGTKKWDTSYWADEIHPNTRGFLEIAKKIDRYARAKGLWP
jgi:hypothetical protein